MKAGLLIIVCKQAVFGIPFVITYHPKFKKIAQIIKKLEHLLCQDEYAKQVFTPPPVVCNCPARKPSSYLVRAQLYPLERKRDSYKCGNLRCVVCKAIEKTGTFSSTVTGESFKINHHLCCTTSTPVHLFAIRGRRKRGLGTLQTRDQNLPE